MQKKPLVSIIVPTKNSGEFLGQCLESLTHQSYDNIEIIVVDNNSSDTTVKIANRYTKNVFTMGPERSTQRNYGVKKSKGTCVAIIDSDMILSKNIIQEGVDFFDTHDEKYAQLIIPEESKGEGYWASVKAYERSFYVGDETIEAPRFFKKSVFIASGGYNEDIRGGGEEYDLPDRISDMGYKTGRVKSFITHLEGHLTLTETTRTKYYYGKTAMYYLKSHPKSAARKFNLLRPVFIKKWDMLLFHPILAISMVIMKLCEFGAGAAGMAKGLYEKHT
jgi:glycosyltransferase involved in cell wall biosynthesis